MTWDGLKITLSGMGGGMTTDKNGKPLLPVPFVFQCPPLEEYQIQRQFNFGTYDTVDDDQYSRRGSRQLASWQFDTLFMYLGLDDVGNYAPHWVPYPTREEGSSQYQRPEWYIERIRDLFVAGSPFRYVAAFKNSTTIHRAYAVLTAFTEVYKHGEGDAIYLSGASFMEWRDPRGKTQPMPNSLPAKVRFRDPRKQVNHRYVAFDIRTGRTITTKSKTRGTTFADLARFYYGNGGQWRVIAKANNCKGGNGDLPVFTRWFKNRLSKGVPTVTLSIPQKPVNT